jgi:uncharacterized protein YeaO (DUF488 family)
MDTVSNRVNGIFTSYYGNLKNIPDDMLKISISRYQPKYLIGKLDGWLKELAPTYGILYNYKNSKQDDVAIDIYNEAFKNIVLTETNFKEVDKIINELMLKYNKTNIVLLCYEKPSDFCHRHQVAKWLGLKYDVTPHEYTV